MKALPTVALGAISVCLSTLSTQAEQVVISEIHYHPQGTAPEFIELRNLTATVFDLSSWKFTDGVEYTFPEFDAGDPDRTFLTRFERVVISSVDEATLRAAYTIPASVEVFGPWGGSLSNGGENIRVEDKFGVGMAEVEYNDDGRKWPIAADGAGHSLVLARANYGAGDWRNWEASPSPSLTPGQAEGAPSPLAGLIELSEVHFDVDGAIDWVELQAVTPTAVPLGGLSLASALDFSDAVALTGSIAGGSVASRNVSFAPDPNGGVRVFLISGTTVLAAARFDRGGDITVESYQAQPAGGEWFAGPGHTRDLANAPVRETDIVINEIMYDAPSDLRDAEFVELYNRGATPVDLGGWRFVDGIGYEFPAGTMLAAGDYVVVGANPDWLASVYGGLQAHGPASGQLRDSGELLRLEDARGNLADEVDYSSGGDWPRLADGDGRTMELLHPSMDNDLPSAWADSDDDAKTVMQSFSHTAPFENVAWPNVSASAQELHMFLVGDSHVIIENVELRPANGGSNLVSNPSTESPTNSSANGWVFQGTHWSSGISGGQINLISDGHGDNKANRAEVNLSGGLTDDADYTLTFDARWVNGKERLIMQTVDHGFGTSFRLPVPEDLGTPGAANSRLLPAAAPVVGELSHHPAVPSPGQTVNVTARVLSGAGPGLSVRLFHREDSINGNATWLQTPMYDNGVSGGDEVAGDGVFTGSLTQYNSQDEIAEFYVRASYTNGQETFVPTAGAELPAMFIIDGRTIPSGLSGERFIISEHDRRAFTGTGDTATYGYHFPRMSNHYFNATFIAGEEEIRYNAELRKSGSPFTRAGGDTLWHGKWKVPADRLFRERGKSVIDPSGVSGESNNTPRFYDDRMARWFLYQLGHPINEMEFTFLMINGDDPKLRESHEPMANDFLDRIWDNGSEGTLLRVDDEWYFPNDSGDSGRQSRNADWAYKDSDNPIRYHTEWLMRSREEDYDYGNFVEFVRTLDGPFTQEQMARMADFDLLALNAAVRGYDADWDTITVRRGKNAYFYRPRVSGRWLLLHWDGDRVFQNNEPIIGSLPGIPTFFNEDYVKRRVNYYLNELLDEHTRGSAKTEAWLQAEKAAVAPSVINPASADPNERGVIMTDSHYRNWFSSRENTARNFIGASRTTAFAITTSPSTTSAAVVSVVGTAPSSVYDVRVAGQPDVLSSWDGLTDWELSGVVLKTGANTITVEGIDHEGEVVATDTLSITKTGGALPVVQIVTDPGSGNVGVSDSVALDATGSIDPDGGLLTFVWDVVPTAGAVLQSTDGNATLGFTQPGLYQVTVTATDPNSDAASATREIAVYGVDGFSRFVDDALEPFWQLQDITLQGNSPSAPYYSLATQSGRLHLAVTGGQAYPLGLPPGNRSTQSYLAMGDSWAYQDTDVDVMATFADPGFDDSGWAVGGGIFGDDSGTFPAPGINTPLDESITNHVTYYFRKEFTFGADPEDSLVILRGVLDDGVRFWLNGQLLGSVNMPLGVITHASSSDGGFTPEKTVVDFGAYDGSAALQTGTNVIAVDLHNERAGSSDIVFGLEMDITANDLIVGGTLDDTIHPWVKRELPASGDWVLQTDIELSGIQFGDFMAGLMVEVSEGGMRSRYGIGYRDGNNIAVVKTSSVGAISTVATFGYTASEHAVVRIGRVGNELVFSWRSHDDDAFSELTRVSLAPGATALDGGPFASSQIPEAVNVLFDYVMLIEAGSTSPVSGDLVITEVMYKPDGGSEYEFLELHNAGPTAINLSGYRFPQGKPFDEFVFGNVTIAPGAYMLVVNDLVAFRSRYGNGLDPQIAGEWAGGSLSNSGETITLLDAADLVVLSFDYNDTAPWPTEPDTDGTSLTLAAPATGSTGNGADWVASPAAGGTPGGSGTVGPFAAWMAARGEVDPLAIKGGEAVNNLLTYAFGTDLAGGNLEASLPATGVTGGQLYIEHRRRLGDPSIGYEIEISYDGETWFPAGVWVGAPQVSSEGDGTERVRFNLLQPLNGTVLLRVRVTT